MLHSGFTKYSCIFAAVAASSAFAQVAGPNVNMVSGTTWPGGDPYLQRQNEPTLAVSTRNPVHLLGGSNDYRTVDIPNPVDSGVETGDAWIGIFRSPDGGMTWRSAPLTGYPQDRSAAGLASVLKNYAVATDPTIRAGTHGMMYLSGLAFNRGSQSASAVFTVRFQDLNNKEGSDPNKLAVDPFAQGPAVLVDTGTSGQFLDKPWIVADIPRAGNSSNNCTALDGKGSTFSSGNVYLVYSKFLGNQTNNTPHSQITFARSTDCGATFSTPQKLSESYQLNQGTNMAVDPVTGYVYVVWRQMAVNSQPDAILWSVSTDFGQTFSKAAPVYTFAAGAAFDQASNGATFRATGLPALAIAPDGRVYVAFSLRNMGPNGAARIMMTTLARGSTKWSTPYVADPTGTGPGHQFLPALSSAYGRIMLVFYDQREDNTIGRLLCPNGAPTCAIGDRYEDRLAVGDLALGQTGTVFKPTISDAGLKVRHTLDVRGALVDPSTYAPSDATPLPFPSTRVSNYRFGTRLDPSGARIIGQLEFNPPNLPMFVKGTRPFVGDYIDVAGLSFVFDLTSKQWQHNTTGGGAAVFHSTWTDNRDVRPPIYCDSTGACSQNWTLYTPVGSTGGMSLYDNTQSKPVCSVGQTGSRNQNIYTSRITPGLAVYVRGNTKPSSDSTGAPLIRAFSVVVQNTTKKTAYYRLTIASVPTGAQASFTYPPSATSMLDVTTPPKTAASRTVYVTVPLPPNTQVPATLKYPTVSVSVVQIEGVGGATTLNGLQGSAIINPDITNPDIVNPDIINPDITNPDITNPDIINPDITSAEVFSPTIINPDIINPDITNPDIVNPDITNPDITNPDITNPDITNIDIANPDIISPVVVNPDITNPDITNPDIINPDITNPDIINPDITSMPSGGTTDVTWKLSNKGNTTATYNAKLLMKQSGLCCPAGCPGGSACPASCFKCQLIVRRTYFTPVANACTLAVQAQNLTIANVTNPVDSGTSNLGQPSNSPDATNTTVSLAPGEGGRVTLRIFGATKADIPQNAFKPVGVANGVNPDAAPAISLTLTSIQLPIGVVGTPYSVLLQNTGGTKIGTAWSVYQGAINPDGLSYKVSDEVSLKIATGTLASSGPLATPGLWPFTAQVKDTKSLDRSDLVLMVNKFSIDSVTADNTRLPGQTVFRGGDTANVTVSVSNIGPAVATGAAVVLTPVSATGSAAASCMASTSGPSQIGSGAAGVFSFLCTVSGDGTIAFRANASAVYANSVATTNAVAQAVTSTTLGVDSTRPQLTVSSGYTPGRWTNQTVTVTFACVDPAAGGFASGVATGYPTGGGNFGTEGTFTSVGNCSDAVGNSADPLSFGPILIDKTPPAVALVTPADGGSYPVNSAASYTCADGLSGVATCAGTVANGSVLGTTIGTNSFTVTASDRAGNTATVVSSYSLTYAMAGFLAPLGTAGTPQSPTDSGTAILGSTVPVRWQLKDALGAVLPSDLASLVSIQATLNAACPGPPPDAASATVLYNTGAAAGAGAFRYDSTLNQYVFSWDTSQLASAGCYYLLAQLNDGKSYATNVSLNKLTIASVAVVNARTSSSTLFRGGDTARATVTLSNAGPAMANGPTATISPTTLAGTASASCAQTSASLSPIPGNSTATAVFECTVAGDGSIAFTAGASASYSTPNGPVTANASTLTSGPATVDSTAPQLSVSATTASDGKPYTSGTWTNQSVSVKFGCTDSPGAPGSTASGVANGSPTGSTTFTLEGAYGPVNGACVDNAGNSAPPLSFASVKIDKTGPAISVVSPANGAKLVVGSTASYSCSDALSGLATCAGPVASGTSLVSPVGPQTFTVNASDTAGNGSSVSNAYTLVYSFTGFLSPLSAAGTYTAPSNSGSAGYGSAVPLKWQLKDAKGAFIGADLTTLALLQAFPNSACSGPPPSTALPITLYNPTSGATGGSTFRYDTTTNQYIFNWDTSSVPGPGCYNVVAKTKDTQVYATIVTLTGCAADATSQYSITTGSYAYNSSTKLYSQTVTIKRTASGGANGPFALGVLSLSSNAAVYQPNGTTSCIDPGSPYITLNPGSKWTNGEVLTVTVQFSNPTGTAITWKPAVLAGGTF